jgi:hypothetical protein
LDSEEALYDVYEAGREQNYYKTHDRIGYGFSAVLYFFGAASGGQDLESADENHEHGYRRGDRKQGSDNNIQNTRSSGVLTITGKRIGQVEGD